MADLVNELADSLGIPASYGNISRVIRHNRTIGLAETGGEFSLDGSLDFFDVPNESLKILDEVRLGDYRNIQRMISIANSMRDFYRADMGDTTDVMGLGELVATLVLLREGMKPQKPKATPDSFFRKYAKIFAPTYVEPEILTHGNSVGTYHTHPFGTGRRPEGKDLMSKRPSLVLDFDLRHFNGQAGLYLIDQQHRIHAFRIDLRKRRYEAVK